MEPSRRDLLAGDTAALETGLAGSNGRSGGGTDDGTGTNETAGMVGEVSVE